LTVTKLYEKKIFFHMPDANIYPIGNLKWRIRVEESCEVSICRGNSHA